MDTKLPSKPTLEGAEISELIWMLYGAPGVGKSTFFSKAKKGNRVPLFLFTDPGLRFIKALKKPILAWKQFKTIARDEIIAKNPRGYSMIVIDTGDLLFRMCRKEVCKMKNISHVSDLEWGKGYDLVRDEFEQVIAPLAVWCQNSGTGLAFTSHAKDVEIRGRTQKTNKLIPSLPKQAREIIEPLCDIIGYAGFDAAAADKSDGAERIAIFEPSETVEAKDRTGLLPKQCSLDYDVVKECLGGGTDSDDEVVEE